MKKLKTPNGIYFGLTNKEAIWLLIQEENLPQIEEKNKNMIYINHERMKTLLLFKR